MLKSYKYRIYPNKQQKQFLIKNFGCARFVYNKSLEHKQYQYKNNNINLSSYDLIKEFLPKLKKEFSWLNECIIQSLQQSIINLDKAYKNFFNKYKKFPKFKNKYSKQSISLPQRVKVLFKENKVQIPKIGKVFAVLHRKFEGKIKTCTISKTKTDKYYISVLVDDDKNFPEKQSGKAIAIDLGIKYFYTDNNGIKINNPKFYNKKLHKIKKLQQLLANKKIGSNNYKKLKFKIYKINEKICNQRNNFLHQLSYKLINNNQVIYLEDLGIKSLLQNSNKNLSRNINDVSWSKFIELLKYKSEWSGKYLVQIGKFEPTSKTCSNCNLINNNLTLDQRKWECSNCHKEHDRDVNAAKNIYKLGDKELNKIISSNLKIRPGCPDLKSFENINIQ